MSNVAGHQDVAQRLHRRKYGISCDDQKRFSSALRMLGEREEAVLLALRHVSLQPQSVLRDMREALLLLMEGE